LIEKHPVPYTAGAACQEFVVPYLIAARKLFEPLGVTETADQFILTGMSDAGLELFDPGLVTA